MWINLPMSIDHCAFLRVNRVPERSHLPSIVQVSKFNYIIHCLPHAQTNRLRSMYRAFQSGFESQPVMCQTINTTMANNCPWASCGEWCLTKTSGFCPQIHAIVRRNGTDIMLENCTRITTTACPQVKPNAIKKYNCNNGTECASLSGVFNCSLG